MKQNESKVTQEQLNTIISDLQGTCNKTIENVIEDNEFPFTFGDLTSDNLLYIDDHVFECSQCGWWCEISDAHEGSFGEPVCSDCLDNEEEADEM